MVEGVDFKIGHYRKFDSHGTVIMTSDDIESHIIDVNVFATEFDCGRTDRWTDRFIHGLMDI